TLDFDVDVFTAGERWLEIDVRTDAGGGFNLLKPRQKLITGPQVVHAWSLGGFSDANSRSVSTNAGRQIPGTNGNQGLEIKVNGEQVWCATTNGTRPNLIDARSGDIVGAGLVGSAFAGGGAPGVNNTIGDSSRFGTIGGGSLNLANGVSATIGGGYQNAVLGAESTIGGGSFNTNNARFYGTIGGGSLNI